MKQLKVNAEISEYIKQRESYLAHYATSSSDVIRESSYEYDHCDGIPKTPFERDKEYILQSSALRHLSNKSQNLVFRNLSDASSRLFHTLQVSEVAVRIAKGLRLNVDLTEAIALGHDIGHMPFSHNTQTAINNYLMLKFTGQKKKQAVLQNLKGDSELANVLKNCFYLDDDHDMIFAHQKQSFHAMHVIERPTKGGLTVNTQLGLLHNYKPKTLGVFGRDIEAQAISFEMLAVELADYITWPNNDLDEAIMKGFVSAEEVYDAPVKGTDLTLGRLLGTSYEERVSKFIDDVVDFNSCYQELERNGASYGQTIQLSPIFFAALNTLKDFFYERVLESPLVYQRAQQVQMAISSLIKAEINQFQFQSQDGDTSFLITTYRDICDKIWRMSDYELIHRLKELSVPQGKVLESFLR